MAYYLLNMKSVVTYLLITVSFMWTVCTSDDPKVTLNVPSETWEGEGALLRCSNLDKSATVTRVDWYKGGNTFDYRVFIHFVSPYKGVKQNYFSDRTVVGRTFKGFYELYINNTVLTDEDTYLCEMNSNKNNATLPVNVKPQVVTITGLAQAVTENIKKELKCHVTRVKPEADIYWRKGPKGPLLRGNATKSKKSDGTFEVQSNYTASFSRNDHNTTLYCFVNPHGTSFWNNNTSATVSVNYPPSTEVKQTSSDSPKDGSSVTLTCDITAANPTTNIKVTWKKNSTQIASSSHYQLSGRDLTISPLDHSRDDGDYSCVGENAVGPGPSSATFTLLVNYPPSTRVTKKGSTPPTQGQSVTLTCDITAGRPRDGTVTWQKGTTPISSSGHHELSDRDFTISSLDHSRDDGNYSCVATNIVGTGVRGVEFPLLVNYPPSTRVTKKGSTPPTQGQSVTLTCDITAGRPRDGTVTWQKGTTPISSSGHYQLSDRDLTVSSLDHSRDDGNYSCHATNLAGTGHRGVEFSLLVNYPPSTRVTKKGSTPPTQGQSVTLTCDITAGRPRDGTVTWQKGTTPISSSGHYQLSDSDLTISSLNHSRDDGNYSCVATNIAGTGVHGVEFPLLVSYKPEVSVDVPLPVKEGDKATIRCQSQARPAVTSVTWKKGGDVITVTGDQHLEGGTVEKPSLTIDPVSRTDAGEYMCLVENSVGQGKVSVQLNVWYRPYGKATVNPLSVTVQVDMEVSLTCRAPSEPGNPTASWFYWHKQDSSDIAKNTTVLTLTPSSVKDSGKYSCVAGNWVGQSDYSDWTTVTVQAPAKIEYPRIFDIPHSPVFDDEDFKMTCTVSGSGDTKVQWRKDGVSVDTGDFAVTTVPVTSGPYMHGQTEAKTSTLMWQVTKRARYFTCNNITHFDGNYTCAVSTQTAGATTNDESKGFIVNVQYEAHWTGGPTVVAAAVDVRAVDIVCSVCANPQPQLTWTFNNESLREGIHVTEDRITLDVVKIDDFGSYECTASNNVNGEHRNVTFPIELVASGPPKKPLEFTVLGNRTSVALTLQWRPGFDGGYPPQVFILQYGTSDKSLTTMDAISTENDVTWYQATVIGLQPETEYVFILHAENKRPQDKGPNKSPTVRQTGSTTAAPRVSIESVTVKEDHMIVTWTYKANRLRRRRSTSVNVSVVIHYEKHRGAKKRYPPEGTVAAEMEEVTIKERFDTEAKYSVWLTVYEGQLAVSTDKTQPFEAAFQEDSSSGIPVVVIAASVAAVVVILIIASLIGVVLYRRRNNNKDCNDAGSKPGSMLMVHRDHEMVDGYSNVACDEAQQADDSNGGVEYAQVNKKKKVEENEAKDMDEDYDDGAVVYTTVVGTKAASANKTKEKKKSEDEKKEDAEDDEDDSVVYTEVKAKPKQAQAATAAKKPEGNNPPIAPKPKGKGKSGNGDNPPKAPKPKKQGKKDKTKGKEETKKPDGDVYVNVNAGSAGKNNADDNVYMNVEKSANSETQPPPETVGPDGTIYADLSFAQSAPIAVKHDEGGDDDEDKVVYAAIDFTKKK